MKKIPHTDIYYGVRAFLQASNLSEKGPRTKAPQKLVSEEAKASAPHSVKNEAHQALDTKPDVA